MLTLAAGDSSLFGDIVGDGGPSPRTGTTPSNIDNNKEKIVEEREDVRERGEKMSQLPQGK